MTVPTTSPALLTTRSLAEALGVNRRTIQRLVASGRLPGIRVGQQWRFDPVAVAEALTKETT